VFHLLGGAFTWPYATTDSRNSAHPTQVAELDAAAFRIFAYYAQCQSSHTMRRIGEIRHGLPSVS